MREILVIRFGALGDLCVLGWALARLADRTGDTGSRVTLVTKTAFAPLMKAMRGVDDVQALEATDFTAVRRLAGNLGASRWDLVLDAHHTLRSHLLLGLLGRRPDARLAKDTAARLAFMRFKRTSPRLTLSMGDRFDAVLARVEPPADQDATAPPLAVPGARPKDAATALGLAPGARWDTKRWPDERFATLLEAYLQSGAGPVRIFLGPSEDAWFSSSRLAAVAAASDQVSLVRGASLLEAAASLAGLGVLVTNDSGLLHLAEAVGTPVVALFGPTVREFGYFPLLPGSRVLEIPLACRPCSRNGKRVCHRGDLACLERISPATVLAAVSAVLQEGSRP